jgi:hypothetical protein
MNTKSLIYIIAICLLAGFLGMQAYHLMLITSGEMTVNLNGNTIHPANSEYYGELTDLLILGKRFAAHHQYNESDYNCKNYSMDFKYIADQLGFDVETQVACKYSNLTKCHMYNLIKVPYEPQSGEFVDMSEKYPYEVK